MEPITCRYCDAPWNAETKRMAHTADCFITTGVVAYRQMRKKRAPPEPVKPLEKSWLDE